MVVRNLAGPAVKKLNYQDKISVFLNQRIISCQQCT